MIIVFGASTFCLKKKIFFALPGVHEQMVMQHI